jgi:hypothetical protein
MIDTFLVAEKTVASAKGDGPSVDVTGAANSVFLITLEITQIIEQESLEVSIYGHIPAEVLSRRVSAIARSDRASRCEAPARALGSSALGTRHRNSDVRVRSPAERNSARGFTRGNGRGQSASLKS